MSIKKTLAIKQPKVGLLIRELRHVTGPDFSRDVEKVDLFASISGEPTMAWRISGKL